MPSKQYKKLDGKTIHKMTAMPPDMAAKVKSAIKTVSVNV